MATREEEFAQLIRLRKATTDRVVRFANYLNEITGAGHEEEIDNYEVASRLNKLENVYDEFQSTQFEIEGYEDLITDDQTIERLAFDTIYHRAMAIVNRLLERSQGLREITVESPSDNIRNNTNSIHAQNSVQLPKINMPTFSGNYESWIEFKSTFESLIHNRAALSGVEKLHYLRSALKDEAAQVIKSVNLTNEAYADAWEMLCDRYDNNRLLLHNHIKALFTLDPITRESCSKLRSIVDTVLRNLKALEHLNQPINSWDTLLVYMVTTKLDYTTANAWESRCAGANDITFGALLSFLRERANALETIESHFSKLLLRNEHVRLFHAGPLAVVNSIRDKYWILSARSVARKIMHDCVTCFRINPCGSKAKMGDLLAARVTPSFPFEFCGVDYAGPFVIKSSFIRNAKTYKAYVAVFVCMSTKAMHLELVTAMTTDAFIATLRRFAARRGKPSEIFCDNGTNFVGARSQLHAIYEFLRAHAPNIVQAAAAEQIKWHFSPPRAPHFGGLYEAGVKSCKYHLKRVTGECPVTYEEFNTLLAQIEAILNSRPISPMSNDPNDLYPLTPAHFLIGRKLTSLPDRTIIDGTETTRCKFQKLQLMVKGFWNRWSKDYLNETTQRRKWAGDQKAVVEVGDLVLVDVEAGACNWILGRITAAHPGRDGVTRVVTITTTKGDMKRPITKVSVMPIKQLDQ